MDGVRRPKDDIAFRALGAVDEAQVTLGVCRSLASEYRRNRGNRLRLPGQRRLFRPGKGGDPGETALSNGVVVRLQRLENDLAALQKDLLMAGGILASSPGDAVPEGMPVIDDDRIAFLSETFRWWRDQVHIEPRFFIGGDTRLGAEFDRTRTVVRRAEREVVRLIRERGVQQQIPVSRFLNQLSDLCFVLARWSDATFPRD
jgi:cob(I)alamin adenosyltransferase